MKLSTYIHRDGKIAVFSIGRIKTSLGSDKHIFLFTLERKDPKFLRLIWDIAEDEAQTLIKDLKDFAQYGYRHNKGTNISNVRAQFDSISPPASTGRYALETQGNMLEITLLKDYDGKWIRFKLRRSESKMLAQALSEFFSFYIF